MPNWWDYIHINRSGDESSSRLQEGLFQIASQTCSILVQVNNTNISYGDNATNVTYNQYAAPAGSDCNVGASTSRSHTTTTADVHVSIPKRAGNPLDQEQSMDLLSRREKLVKRNSNVFANYKHRLSVSKTLWMECPQSTESEREYDERVFRVIKSFVLCTLQLAGGMYAGWVVVFIQPKL